MRLDQLRLKNYRCFANLRLSFHEQLTVLVAENGQGKTAILDAIRVALWPFVSSFDLARNSFNDPGNAIAVNDVRRIRLPNRDMARQLPCRISTTGDFGQGVTKTWTRYREQEARYSKTKDGDDTGLMRQYATELQTQIRNLAPNVPDLPVFGYYGTGRLWAQKKLTEAPRGEDDTRESDFYIRTFAYMNCLNPASSYKHFKEWFIWGFESYREQQIRQLENRGAPDDLTAAQGRIQVVQQAIDHFLSPVTGWHTLEYSVSHEKALVLHHDLHGILAVESLSDGIRSLLAMVGDIAYRCIKLNPHFGANAAQQTNGVVLIDELDMHLHPRWQQVILDQLIAAFPRIQFIVTTHSPQVLTSVDASCIRLLQQTSDPETGATVSVVVPVTTQTRGVSSADLLARIMDIDPVPAVPEAQWLANYQALIQQNRHETDDGQALRARLEQHFGGDHPVMRECERLIRLQGFRQRLPRRLSNEEG